MGFVVGEGRNARHLFKLRARHDPLETAHGFQISPEAGLHDHIVHTTVIDELGKLIVGHGFFFHAEFAAHGHAEQKLVSPQHTEIAPLLS